MDLSLSISNRQINPAVVNVYQFENDTTTLTFTLDSYVYDQIDLRKYKAYAITSINGHVDMTELVSDSSSGKLKLTWTLQEYTLRYAGAIQYQIVFKQNASDGENTAVFYSYKAIILSRISIDADDHITANYPTLLKQWIDRINQLSGTYESEVIYMPAGKPIDPTERLAGRLYYQIENSTTYEGHFEDHNGNRLGEFNAKYVTNANMNTLLENGDYICAGTMSNMPILNTYCIVRVTDSGSTNRVLQEVYVPADNNTVRAFVRAITGTNTFGAWMELSTVGYVDALIGDKDFEIEALMSMHTQGLTELYIDSFEDTSALSSVPSGYDSRLHLFNISGSSTLIFNTKQLASACDTFWINVDWANVSSGAVAAQVSTDMGSTWTDVTNDTLTSVTSSTNFSVKLTFTGSLTLKNVAFGMK